MAVFIGTGGNDFYLGTRFGDVISGGGGSDFLAAGDGGFDLVFGGTGNDILLAGSGFSTLIGNAGNDVYGFSDAQAGFTLIADWQKGEDKIDLSTLSVTSFDDVEFYAFGLETLIVAGEKKIVIAGFSDNGPFDVDDFIFADPAEITFEDAVAIDFSGKLIDGYKGFDWENFFVGVEDSISGFDANSGTKFILNGFGEPASISSDTDFDLESLYMSAGFRDNLEVTISGYDDGVLVGSQTFVVSHGTSTYYEMDDAIFDSVDRVEFVASGGIDIPGDNRDGTHFSLDDVLIIA